MTEISDLMKGVCKKIEVYPVGKGKRHYEDYLIKLGLTEPEVLRRCWHDQGMNLLEDSERLLCIGTL